MAQDLYIAVIAGTSRSNRKSIKAAKYVAEIGNQMSNVNTVLVDPAEYTLPGDGENTEDKDSRYSEITAKADGFFIVTPEYNHSIPGSLKRLLDSEFDNYKYKAVSIAGVSSGPWGGVRAIEALLPIVRTLNLLVTKTDAHFPNISNAFDDEGNLVNDSSRIAVEKTFNELIWLSKVMKDARDSNS